MYEFWQDLRYGARMLLKKPAFSLVTITTLALGIGANTAIFSIVNAVLLRPLPFADPDRLMLIWGNKQQDDWPELPLSLPNFNDIREQSKSFEAVSAWTSGYFNLTSGPSGSDAPERIQYAIVSANLFATLGAKPAIGRDFAADEDQPGASRAIIISHSLWQRRFGEDRGAIGRTVTLDGQGYEVCGVLPPGFRFISFPKDTEVWLPFGLDPFRDRKYVRGANALGVVARLDRGFTVQEARAEMETIAARLRDQYPEFNRHLTLNVVPLREQAVKKLRPGLVTLLLAVGFVLLIACANVANLQLTRAAGRQKEIAIRAALGASRRQIVRQLLTENLMMSALSGAAGLLIAVWGIELLGRIPYNTPNLFTPYQVAPQEIGIDGYVLAVTVALSLLTGIAFGLAPILQAARLDLQSALKEGGAKLPGGTQRGRARGVLVVAEVALAIMLLVGAGLAINSFFRLQRVDPGFDPENALKFDVSLPASKYDSPEKTAGFYSQLTDRLSALPGVLAVGAVEYLPLSGTDGSTGVLIEGQPIPPASERPKAHWRSTTPDYFRAMGIRLLDGREISNQDRRDTAKVAVVNETLARKFWPGASAIGKRLAIDFEAMRFYRDRAPEFDLAMGLREIVGVVADVKHQRLDGESFPEMYVPESQRGGRDMTVVLRTAGDPLNLSAAVRAEVLAVDKEQPITNISSMSRVMAASVAQPRFNSIILGAFAAIALLLSVVGIYGVISYSVAERTHEIGIRMALGATALDVLRLVVGQGLRLTLIGAAIGVAGAMALTRLMTSLLYNVSPTDPVIFAAVLATLVFSAFVACLVPARRAVKVDPTVALRYE
jgi:putative ABC transport system permease protein